MFIPGKIASITLSAVLGIGGLGAANAALSPESQQEDIKNQTPVVSTDVSQPSYMTTMQDDTNFGSSEISPEQMNRLHDNWLELVDYGLGTKTSDLYEKMVQKDKQLMQNVTREQMLKLDREWMEQNQTMHRNWERLMKNGAAEDNEDLYERMVQIDQQMMKHVTPDHFNQLDSAWMKQFKQKRQAAPASNAQINMEGTASMPSSSMTKQGINHDTEDPSVHSSHDGTNNDQTKKVTDKQKNMNQGKTTTSPTSSITKQGINHDMEDPNVHSSHDGTRNDHTRTESEHQRNMNQSHQNRGHN